MTAKEILSQMTLKEKLLLCEGGDFWHTRAFRKYGLRAVMMCDGPHGLRKQTAENDMLGVNASVPATCFPTAVAVGCSWDEALLARMGEAIGREARANGVSMVLGPGLNIQRDPLCGRNFEYFSEDPLLSGRLAGAWVRGAQRTGTGACLKHFAANSQEYKRFSSDSVMDMRTLREIYLTGFELAVKQSRPASVMCSYNRLNGEHASDSRFLLTDILRREWGFDGFVVTDWGALNDRTAALKAGCDLNMPGGSRYQIRKAMRDVREGRLSVSEVDACAERILNFILRAQETLSEPCDMAAHHALAREAAEQSAVLLKNDGALPVRGTACLIGYAAKHMRYQGSGSSHIHPAHLTSPCACLDWPWAEGCLADGSTTDALIDEAVRLAATVETPVIFAALPDSFESEGFDREHMRMPDGVVRLIEAVAKANRNTAVVLLCGSPVETPWLDDVNALLYMGLSGEAGGEAAAALLTGAANPCGRLAQTWPLRYDDAVTSAFYGTRDGQYREGVFVGYRYYETAKKPVRFPFGCGLSYTSFAYSDLTADAHQVSVTVRNTGTRAGSEIVQLYIAPPAGVIARPARELRGFAKVTLAPDEEQRVTLPLDARSFAVWDGGWRTQGGVYTAEIGGLRAPVTVEGEALCAPAWQHGTWYETLCGTPELAEWERLLGRKYCPSEPEKGSYTTDSSIVEMMQTSRLMRLLYRAVCGYLRRGAGSHGEVDEATVRMMQIMGTDCALRGAVINAGLPDRLAEGLVQIANGHTGRGLLTMIFGAKSQ